MRIGRARSTITYTSSSLSILGMTALPPLHPLSHRRKIKCCYLCAVLTDRKSGNKWAELLILLTEKTLNDDIDFCFWAKEEQMCLVNPQPVCRTVFIVTKWGRCITYSACSALFTAFYPALHSAPTCIIASTTQSTVFNRHHSWKRNDRFGTQYTNIFTLQT